MNVARRPTLGEEWATSASRLAKAYGWPEEKMNMAIYAVAEQMHQHFCLSRGSVQHNAPRPDQHIALSVIASLAGAGWWLDQRHPSGQTDESG